MNFHIREREREREKRNRHTMESSHQNCKYYFFLQSFYDFKTKASHQNCKCYVSNHCVLMCLFVFQSEKIKLTSIVTKFVSSCDFSQPSLEGPWDAFILSSFSFSLQASAPILRAENRSKTSGQKELKFQSYQMHEQP